MNDTKEKWTPHGAIDQLGHSLKRIIHAFAEVEDNAVILMAKWDIQDGFWHLKCCKGEEWNFYYIWPQAPGKPRRLIVPSLLQMGWVESAPYFCVASETLRDVMVEYIKTSIGSLPEHKFKAWVGATMAMVNNDMAQRDLRYVMEVYVNDYISCIVPTSRKQIEHIARGILHGIHNIFPPGTDNSNDLILAKKLRKGDGAFETNKCLLGFDFAGVNKTIWLEEEKQAALLMILHHWIRGATKAKWGIPFAEFDLVTAKFRHVLMALREGCGLLSLCNQVIQC